MSIRFSIRALFAITACCAIGAFFVPTNYIAPPDPEWRHFCGTDIPLKNIPIVELESNDDSTARAKITNSGATTLQFISDIPGGVTQYVELENDEGWHASDYSWCPMGQMRYDIQPNESVQVSAEFRCENYRERILARFIEKGTNRSGMVVIATEPK